MIEKEIKQTISGTNIDEVKRLNAQSGLSYNEVLEKLAKENGTNELIKNNKEQLDVK